MPLKVIGNIFKVIMSSGLRISVQGSGGKVYKYCSYQNSAEQDVAVGLQVKKETGFFFFFMK